ncbi:MAG: glycosyltransferase family 4 protein [Spirosomataceae bacterium]
MKQNILFVGHDANRAGSQILLLRFLTLLKADGRFSFTVLLKDGGELEEEYRAVAPTFLWHQPVQKPSVLKRVVGRITNKMGLHTSTQSILKESTFDLIVVNTFTNGELFPFLQSFGCPILTYVHELEMGIQMYTHPEEFQQVLKGSAGFIACAESIRQNLLANHGVTDGQIHVLPSLLPDNALIFEEKSSKSKALRAKYGIPADALLVGGMGTVDLRKGVDIFLRIANQVKQEPISFLWVGGKKEEVDFQLFEIDRQKLGLHQLTFQDSVSNPLDYMAMFDIFCISSREDPYPLVVLEAALLGKPILCFDEAGGAKDFVEEDAGVIVPYLDVKQMAAEIRQFQDNPVRIKQMGDQARKKVLERHDKERAFQKFVSILSTSIQ